VHKMKQKCVHFVGLICNN